MVTVTENELKADPWGAFTSGRGSAVRVIDDRTGKTLFYLTSSENLRDAGQPAVIAVESEGADQYYVGLAEAARATGVHRSTISRSLAPKGDVMAKMGEDGHWWIDKKSLHEKYPLADEGPVPDELSM